MIDLHCELKWAMDKEKETNCVKCLGRGIYAQFNKSALDDDEKEGNLVAITREETRGVVNYKLDALKVRSKVCATGQAGIEKTRGCMMYATNVFSLKAQLSGTERFVH